MKILTVVLSFDNDTDISRTISDLDVALMDFPGYESMEVIDEA